MNTNAENLRENVEKAVSMCGETKLLDFIIHENGSYQIIVMATNPKAAKLAAVTAHMEIFRAVNPTNRVKIHATSEVPVTTTSEECNYACVVCNSTGEVSRFL